MGFPNYPLDTVDGYYLPDYGATVIEDQLGLEKRRVVSTDGVGATLEVSYNYLNSSQVLEFITFYKDYEPNNRGFVTPQSILLFPDEYFQSFLKSLGKYLLFFEAPPRVETAYSDIYRVSLRLRAVKQTVYAGGLAQVIKENSYTVTGTSSSSFVQWEQISGAPCFIDSPNSLTTQIRSQGEFFTGLSGRLIFKLSLIDNPDVFDLFEIVASPTSFFDGGSFSGSISRGSAFPDSFRIQTPLSWSVNPHPEGQIYLPRSTRTTSELTWAQVESLETLLYYELEYWDGNSWELNRTIYPNELRKITIPSLQTFRLIAVHDITGTGVLTRAISPFFNINPAASARTSIGVSDLTMPISVRTGLSVEDVELSLSVYTIDEDSPYPVSLENSKYLDVVDLPLTITIYYYDSSGDLAAGFTNDGMRSSMDAQLSGVGGITSVVNVDLGGTVIG